MLFNSFEFLFLFLPIMLGFFYLTLKYKLYNLTGLVLSVGSLVFYGYWSIKYLGLLLVSIIVNYFIGNILKDYKNKALLTVGVLFNLLILGYYKYFNFFLEVANLISPHSFNLSALILPLAISFYTFQQVAYLFDSYKGIVKNNKFIEYLFFVCFFPQLIAGPIVQHQEIVPQLKWKDKYPLFTENVVIGLTIFTIGLIKKTVIADNVGALATPVFTAVAAGEAATFFEAWGAALAYNLQVYFDFSGYSDMAIGLGRMFGILLPQNFNSPFKSRSIIEFWQRWHMTLGRVIYTYVFLPLSMFFTRLTFLRKKPLAVSFFTIILTYLLVGFWHGAGWTFICFGLIQGAFYFINFAWRQFGSKRGKKLQNQTKGSAAIYWGITYLSLVVSFVIFRADSITAATSMYYSMIGGNGFLLTEKYYLLFNYFFGLGDFLQNVCHWKFSETTMLFRLGTPQVLSFAVLLFIVFCMPNTQDMMARFSPCLDNKPSLQKKSIITIIWQPNLWYAYLMAFALIVSYCFILAGQSEFLYFAF